MNERHLFTAALHQDDPAAYLREACAGDEALRRRVEDLLEAHRLAGAFLEGGPPVGAAPSDPVPTVGSSVLKALAAALPAVPRVHLRDPLTQDHTPVSLPGSAELPAATPDATARYHFFGEIAHGGMGAVLKGRDTDLGRDVAVKVLLDAHHGKVEMIQRFVEEAQVGGQLQHPGIVPVYELGQFPDRRPFFAMKLVKGQTLAKLLKQRPGPADELPRHVQIFAQVCQALAYAHARGVIHRDLKPANVMVGAFGEVQVMDWGLAKVLRQGGVADEQPEEAPTQIRTVRSADAAAGKGTGSDTRAGSVLGTPAYMAPEQANGQVDRLDERSDVFGLGAILCEILTGQPPYTGRDGEAVYKKASAGDTAAALARLGGCGADADLIELARCCLAADPLRRPRDAGAVAAAVTQYQESVTERLRQAELERAAAEARAEEEQNTRRMAEAKAAEERRRRRAQLGLAAAAVLLVVLGGGAAAWSWQEQAAMTRDVEAALAEAERQRDAGRWPEARAALERAEGRLGGGGPAELRERLGQAKADARVVAELEEALIRVVDLKEGRADFAGVGWRYEAAFRDYGIDVTALPEAEAAERVRASAVRDTLLAALDSWAWREDRLAPLRAKLRAVADGADDNGWRRAFRVAAERGDVEKLRRLAADGQALAQPSVVLVQLSYDLLRARLATEAVALLGPAQRRHPADFWLNHFLAIALNQLSPPRAEKALGFFRAALALRPRSPVAHTNLGLALLHTGDVDGAIQSYRRALELDPKSAWAHNGLGGALRRKGDTGGAVHSHRRAVELDPQNVQAHYNLGNVLFEKGDVRGAMQSYRRALALAPRLAPAHVGLGIALYAQKDVDGAIASYHRALELDPTDALAHNNLGNALQSKGDVAGALRSYRRALELDPGNARAHNNLGGVLCDVKHDYDAAAGHFRKAIDLEPKLANAHNGLGVALKAKGDVDGAVRSFRRALELDPKGVQAHINLGFALHAQKDVDGAIGSFRRALELDPKSVQAHLILGIALKRTGDVDGAIRSYHRALDLDPAQAKTHGLLGEALYARRDVDGAIGSFRRALELDPNYFGARLDLATALTAKKDVDGAVQSYRQAIRIDPNHARAHFGLGQALKSKGDVDGAVQSYRRAIELDPDYAEAHCNLGLVLGTKGAHAESLTSLRHGHELGAKRPGWNYPSAEWVRQAERMVALEKKLPAILKGDAQPADTAERLMLAQICYNRAWHAAAARLWSEALAADAKLADDVTNWHRYNAACAAALAGCGLGKDDPPPDAAAKAKLRQQARDWLRADLAAYAQLVAGKDPPARALVPPRLRHWQTDPDLAGLRDQEAVAELPGEERQACQNLWAEVGVLLKKAREKTKEKSEGEGGPTAGRDPRGRPRGPARDDSSGPASVFQDRAGGPKL